MKTRSKKTLTVALIMVIIVATSMMALAAENPSVAVNNPAPEVGDTIVFTVTPNNFTLEGKVSASSNLTYVSSTGASDESGFFTTMESDVRFTYRVNDGSEGQEFTFTVSGLEAHDGGSSLDMEPIAGSFSASGTVAGEPAAPETPSPEPTSPEPSTPRPSRPQQLDDAPKTGDVTTDYGTIALWVIAIGAIAALGTAGFIAHKKSSAK